MCLKGRKLGYSNLICLRFIKDKQFSAIYLFCRGVYFQSPIDGRWAGSHGRCSSTNYAVHLYPSNGTCSDFHLVYSPAFLPCTECISHMPCQNMSRRLVCHTACRYTTSQVFRKFGIILSSFLTGPLTYLIQPLP